MPEVITNTSPIQYLYQINQLNLLPTLHGQVKMPQAVADDQSQDLPKLITLIDLVMPVGNQFALGDSQIKLNSVPHFIMSF